jgi:hypothetical protein
VPADVCRKYRKYGALSRPWLGHSRHWHSSSRRLPDALGEHVAGLRLRDGIGHDQSYDTIRAFGHRTSTRRISTGWQPTARCSLAPTTWARGAPQYASPARPCSSLAAFQRLAALPRRRARWQASPDDAGQVTACRSTPPATRRHTRALPSACRGVRTGRARRSSDRLGWPANAPACRPSARTRSGQCRCWRS